MASLCHLRGLDGSGVIRKIEFSLNGYEIGWPPKCWFRLSRRRAGAPISIFPLFSLCYPIKKWNHIMPWESRSGGGVRMAVRVFASGGQGTLKLYGHDNN
jgi:hypothetical protein